MHKAIIKLCGIALVAVLSSGCPKEPVDTSAPATEKSEAPATPTTPIADAPPATVVPKAPVATPGMPASTKPAPIEPAPIEHAPNVPAPIKQPREALADKAPGFDPGNPDRSCKTDSDCVVKDVGNCCGRFPACVNKNAKTDPAAVRAQCGKDGMASICGFEEITACQCVEGQCRSAAGNSVVM